MNYVPKTQKALGLQVLQRWHRESTSPRAIQVLYPIHIRKAKADGKIHYLTENDGNFTIERLIDRWGRQFARPCPTIPRHGFVESRQVSTTVELEELAAAAYTADPNAEILLTPYIPANFNAVVANGTITVGPGHDGATGGKDCMTFPTLPNLGMDAKVMVDAGITNAPYIEVVYSADYCPTVTQLRDGPAVKEANATRWVPASQYIKNIVTVAPDMNLLEWEKQVATLRPKYDVVHIPGGSLSCHAAVHAILHKIAVVCDKEPLVLDDVLHQTTTQTAKPKPFRANLFRRGLQDGLDEGQALKLPFHLQSDYPHLASPVALALYMVHNAAAIDFNEPRMTYLLGWCSSSIMRLAVGACIAEARYGRLLGNGKVALKKKKAGARNGYYHVWIEQGAFGKRHIQRFNRARAMFGMRWLNEGISIGGAKWHACANVAMSFWNTTVAVANGLIVDDAALSRVVMALNALINVCHNSTYMLSKFLETHVFDAVATAPAQGAIIAAPIMYNLLKQANLEDIEDEQPQEFQFIATPKRRKQRAVKLAPPAKEAAKPAKQPTIYNGPEWTYDSLILPNHPDQPSVTINATANEEQ